MPWLDDDSWHLMELLYHARHLLPGPWQETPIRPGPESKCKAGFSRLNNAGMTQLRHLVEGDLSAPFRVAGAGIHTIRELLALVEAALEGVPSEVDHLRQLLAMERQARHEERRSRPAPWKC